MTSDLHLHSTVSDGILKPADLVAQAYEAGIRILALTDHDSTDGINEATEKTQEYPDLILIPGVELSTDTNDGEIHILGYFLDIKNKDLQTTLKEFRSDRLGRAQSIVEKLNQLGFSIEWDLVKEIAGDGSVGRPHIAEALLQNGHVKSIKEAFDKFIGRNGPAYSERRKMEPSEAVNLITTYSGIPILAHPREVNNLENLLPDLVDNGLKGMEVYYGLYSEEERLGYLNLCNKFDLLPTGGSDYHGPGRAAECDLGGSNTAEHIGSDLIQMHHDST